jgi:hypothetical protein
MRRRQIEAGRAVEVRLAPAAASEAPGKPDVPLAELRARAGLTVAQVAERLGLKPGAVELVERTEATRARIREFLNG